MNQIYLNHNADNVRRQIDHDLSRGEDVTVHRHSPGLNCGEDCETFLADEAAKIRNAEARARQDARIKKVLDEV